MKSEIRFINGEAIRYQKMEQSSLRKFVDYLGLTVIFGLGVLGLLSLSAIPGFQLALFSIVGTRVAAEGIPNSASSKSWESLIKNLITGAFFLTLAAAVITYCIAISALGAVASSAATVLPFLFVGMVGLGVLHTGISLIGEMREYFKTPHALRTDLMRHKLQTTAVSTAFQAALTAAIVCSVVIPGAQVALAAIIPFALVGMIAFKLWERQKTKQLIDDQALIDKVRADKIASYTYTNHYSHEKERVDAQTSTQDAVPEETAEKSREAFSFPRAEASSVEQGFFNEKRDPKPFLPQRQTSLNEQMRLPRGS